jgi:hypothetical protein
MQETEGNHKYRENKIDPFFLYVGERKYHTGKVYKANFK